MTYRRFTLISLLTVSAAAFLGAGAQAQAQTPPLTLSAAITQALAANPSALAAQQQLVQYQARLAQAEAGRRFQITFNSTAGGSSADVIQPPPSHENFYTLQNTLTVPLPIGAKPGLAVREAQEQFQSAQALYTSARFTLAAQVGAAYFDLLRKQALLLVAQQTLTQAQRQLDEATKRNTAGDVPQLDVIRAQVPVATAQAQLLLAQNDVAVAQQTLNSLVGQPLDAPLSVADVTPDSFPLTTLTLPQARSRAVAYSPDVLAAQDAVRADRAALKLAQLFRQPTLSLQAIDIRSNDQTSFSRVDTVQAAVTVPLSDGGLGRAQVREAQAALAQARAQEAVARRAVLAAVSAAYLTAQSARGQVTAARAARDIAQISATKTEQGYRNGLFPLTDVLNAQAALTQAQIAYTQTVYAAAAAANTLNAALTGGLVTNAAPTLTPSPILPSTPMSPGTGASGTSPAGAGIPGTSPSGNSTTGINPGGANAAGRGAP